MYHQKEIFFVRTVSKCIPENIPSVLYDHIIWSILYGHIIGSIDYIKFYVDFIMKISQPIESTWIWDDAGSGANSDVAIYSLTPPSSDYTCLGHVATKGNSIKPDLSNYRCVKNDFLALVYIPESTRPTWNDSGSGVHYDFAAFRIPYSTRTIQSGLFWSHRSHDGPNQWVSALEIQPAVKCISSYNTCVEIDFSD